MTMTRDKIEELKRLYAAMTNCEMYGEDGAAKGVMVPQSLLDQFERALAERALEPQTDLQKLYQANLAKSEKLLASWPLPAKKPVAYMAQHVSGSWNPLLVADDEDDGIELAEGWSYQPVYAATSSALEPQGQALPELPKGWPNSHPYSYTADDMRAYARAYASQLALPAGPQGDGAQMHANRPESRATYRDKAVLSVAVGLAAATYVECRECDSCGHTGMNDDDGWRAACNICGWAGAAPEEDKCPECHREGTMSAACPKCGGLYRLLAAKAISSPSPAVAQLPCQTCGDQGDVYVVKREGELPSHDLAPCPDCTKSVAQPVSQQFPTKLHLSGAISVLFNQEQKKFHDEQASLVGMGDSWTSWEQHYNNALADFFWPMVGAVAQPVADEREAFEDAWPEIHKHGFTDGWKGVAIAAWQTSAALRQSAPLRFVGEVGSMPGTSGFTMACFKADKVPMGTKLYARAALCQPAEEGDKA